MNPGMMEEAALSPLARWENFYVIVGSSAGALTGLQFVVIALIAEAETAASMLEIRAFGSPTVVHFCVSLLISAIISAPWTGLFGAGVVLGLSGLGGAIYVLMVIRHARRQRGYQPDLEDWLWYAWFPLSTYVALATAGFLLARHSAASLFVIATSALALLFIGIHNAWDTVTYIAVTRRGADGKREIPKSE
jgi:hypothetical protein